MKRKFKVNLRIRFSNPYGLGNFIGEGLRHWNNHRPWVTPSFDLIKIKKQNNNNLDCYYIYSSGFACPDFFIKEIIPCYEETN